MKGIYLTPEGKQELDTKIIELSGYKDEPEITELKVLREILSLATVLPVEEYWKDVIDHHDVEGACKKYYPNGVIIQPKK